MQKFIKLRSFWPNTTCRPKPNAHAHAHAQLHLNLNLNLNLLAILLLILNLIFMATMGIDCALMHGKNQSLVTGTAGRPYWHKPGCHQVGHTRTISIPGCVKFNLSTNACRGFCMSFSIPATEDIGPAMSLPAPPLPGHPDHLDAPATSDPNLISSATPTTMAPLIEIGGTMDSQQLASVIGGQLNGQPLIITRRLAASSDHRRHQRTEVDEVEEEGKVAGNKQQMLGAASGGMQMREFLHLAGQTKSPLAGAVGDLSDKRDVISVGQCCNMMETEDVTINLRCGLNETRKLVFKSAKTCECFFCKHL